MRGLGDFLAACSLVALFVASLLFLLIVHEAQSAEADTVSMEARLLLQARQRTVLSSRIEGRIERILVREGEHFGQGALLVEMDCAIHEARLRKVSAMLMATEASLSSQQQLESLNAGSAVTTQLAVANRAKAQAETEEMAVMVEMCRINAPFAGLVVRREAQPHQSIDKGRPILEILDDTILDTRLIAPVSWLSWLVPGTPYQIQISGFSAPRHGRVVQIIPQVDVASQLLTVIGDVDGATDGLMDGMSGIARFERPAP